MADREEGAEYEVRFHSSLPSGHPANDEAILRVFVPKLGAGPYPCVLLLHYWGATDLRMERDLAGELNRRGIAAVAVVLPYHLGRTPPGTRSGELAIRPDVGALTATMRQCIADVRRAADWVATRPEFRSGPLGIGGTSLGAIVGSLAFAVDERFLFSSSMLGGVDLAGILWTSSRVTAARDALRRQGITESILRDRLQPIEPLTYLKPLAARPGSRSYVIAARFDHVVRPEFAQKLIDRLGGAEALWLDTGHYGGAFVERSVNRSIATFYERAFAGEPFAAPRGLFAPTIRVGLFASDEGGLQVGAGIDVWRADHRGKGFASALLTPRGARGFVGVEVTRGLSLGVSASARRTTWGVFWNLVL